MITFTAVPSFANPVYKAPDNIKTQEQFWKFRDKFSFNGDYKKFTEFFKANQQLLQNLFPGFVDIAYTRNLTIQTEEAINRAEFEIEGKKVKMISVPIRIQTYNKDNSPFGMELSTLNFALISKNIAQDKKLPGAILFPDAFTFIDQVGPYQRMWVDNWQEYFVYINFILLENQDEKNYNLRLLDGKDYVDINITK